MKTKVVMVVLLLLAVVLSSCSPEQTPAIPKALADNVLSPIQVPGEAPGEVLSYSYNELLPMGNGDVTTLRCNLGAGANWFAVNGEQRTVPIQDAKLKVLSLQAGELTPIFQQPIMLVGGFKVDKTTMSATFDDYVYGSGLDLYTLEAPPSNDEDTSHVKRIEEVLLRALCQGGRARLCVKVGELVYYSDWFITPSSTTFIEHTWAANPATGEEWKWKDIAALQIGVELQDGICTWEYVRVKVLSGSQTFYFQEPADFGAPGSFYTWNTYDLDSYIGGLGSDVTGVMVRSYCTSTGSNAASGARKQGSTDTWLLYQNSSGGFAWWTVGVDSNHQFQLYFAGSGVNRTYFQLCGYTKTGVTMSTNAPVVWGGTGGVWTTRDLSAYIASGSVGVYFTTVGTTSTPAYYSDVRCYGAATSQYASSAAGYTEWVGVDGSRRVQQNCSASAGYGSYVRLMGYCTDGATFYVDSVTETPAGTTGWQDLSSALPSGAIGGFLQIIHSSTSVLGAGARKNTSSDAFRYIRSNTGAFVACHTDQVIEGYRADSRVSYHLLGYATAGGIVNVATVDAVTKANLATIDGVQKNSIMTLDGIT